jgi:hypothetical protein
MPPQQAYGLLDLVDQILGFGTHEAFPLPDEPGLNRRGP